MTRLIDADKLEYFRCKDNKCDSADDVKCQTCEYAVIHKHNIDNALTVIPEEMKPLIEKTIEILPQLTDAIVENLPRILDDIDICQECEYRKTSFKEADKDEL